MTTENDAPATPRTPQPQVYELAFESYGVHVGVCTDQRSLLPRLQALVPPRHRAARHDEVEHRLLLSASQPSLYNVAYMTRSGVDVESGDVNATIVTAVDLGLALAMLEAHVHGSVARFAPEHVFVNAAVVEHRGSAMLLPGRGMSGRTTLARALADAGARLHSDMFAVIDREGRIHPYLPPEPQPADGGADGLPAGAVVFTSYVPGAKWRPQPLSRGQCTVELLTHTVPAQESPQHAMQGVKAVLDGGPLMLSGERGEAAEMAGPLLAELERSLAAA